MLDRERFKLFNINLLLFLLLLLCSFLQLSNSQSCIPEDCVVSEWSLWKDCSQTCGESGVRSRKRVVFRNATCGGKCPYNVTEAEPCNIRCCPVDCVYTPWTDWGLCYCTDVGCEGEGERHNCRRTRVKLSNSSCGGYCDEVTAQEACGYLCCRQDCALDQWSIWSACDGLCEQPGIKNRTRGTLQQPTCGGKQCESTEEFAPCMGPCCPVPCVLGEWGQWSTCNTSCGEATQTRERFVQLPVCGGTECPEDPISLQNRTCANYDNVDCVVSAWSSWSPCYLDNGFCGDGTKSRTREIVTAQVCKGNPCGNLTETGICYGPCCRKDCEVTPWSEWGFCSSSCGQGISNRTRSITAWPSCGGAVCPTSLLNTRSCLVTNVVNCQFTDWSIWTTCSSACGNGVMIRSRRMLTPAYCGGACENELTYEEQTCESFTARQHCEVTEWSQWSACKRNCESGIEQRNRTVITNPTCGGSLCPNITETRSCHQPCQQLCNASICSCRLGYKLDTDNATCTEITCPVTPKIDYCPATHKNLTDCRAPLFNCTQGNTLNRTCVAYCKPSEWTLKGSSSNVTCQKDGTWSKPLIFCFRPNKPPIGIEIDKTKVEENTPKDKCFAYLSTITAEGEQYEIHTYNITKDDTKRFYIKENRVCLAKVPNYEEPPNKWNVTFRSTDIDGKFVEHTFTFEVLNANDPPTSARLEPNTIPENSPVGTFVGCFVGTDDESGDNISFTMIDSEQNTFACYQDGKKTCLKVNKESAPRCATEGGTFCVLNRELQGTHKVTVRATDDAIPPMSAIFDVPVYLSDVNDQHTAVIIKPDTLPENVPPGQPLVRLVAIDEDKNQTYIYRIIQDLAGLFSVNTDSLTASKVLDYETEKDGLFEIEVEAVDDAVPPKKVTSVIKMRLKDINEAPYQLQVSSLNGVSPFDINKPTVVENVIGVIGTISVMDPDNGDAVNIRMDGLNGNLRVLPTTCTTLPSGNVYCTSSLSVNKPYDYEKEKHVNLSFIAADKSNLQTRLNVTMEILNTNDPPSVLLINQKEQLSIEINENLIGFEIGILSTKDDDVNDTHKYTLVESGGGKFVIQENRLKTSPTAVIDFEEQDLYKLIIRVTDNGSPIQYTDFTLTVRIVDINEPPSSTQLSSNQVLENSPEGTIVGTLRTLDPDNVRLERQSFQYTLSDDSLGRFAISGNKLLVRKSRQLCGIKACAIDYEKEDRITVVVITLDNGKPRLQREDRFIITVIDENDPPSDIRIDSNVIEENQQPGTNIGKLSAVDEDGIELLEFTLQDSTESFEIINGNHLVTKATLNYEQMNSFRVTISVRDNGDPPAMAEDALTINVIDVNEPPGFVNMSDSVTVGDDEMVGNSVATFTMSDPDSSESLVVQLAEFSGTFTLSAPVCKTTLLTGATDCTSNLKLNQELNFGVTSSYTASLSVSDKEGLYSKRSLQINIEDRNNQPTDILCDGISISELRVKENTNGTKVCDLMATDKDKGQTCSFKIVSNPSNIFAIEGDILKIASNAKVDFETMPKNTTLEIQTIDSGIPPQSFIRGWTLVVEDINDAPSSVSITSNKVAENSATDTLIGTITVTDPDVNQNHSISLVNDAKRLFKLEGSKLLIGDAGGGCPTQRVKQCRLNYEEVSKYTVSVEVRDSGYPPMIAVFDLSVDVSDLNEPPTNIRLMNNKLRIGSLTGTLVGVLTVDDDDKAQTHSFVIVGSSKYLQVSLDGQVKVLDTRGLLEGQVIEISVKAIDNGSPSLSVTESVKVIVVGTNVITVNISAYGSTKRLDNYNFQIEENNDIYSPIATVVMSYPIIDKQIVLHDVSDGFIKIANVSCKNDGSQSKCLADLKPTRSFDYEAIKLFDVTLNSSVDKTSSLDIFRVSVINVNEAPTAINFSSGNISAPENSRNQLLGRFVVIDADMNDFHKFSSIENKHFILMEDGRLYTSANAALDYESHEIQLLTITAVDSGKLNITSNFNVTVLDVNEKPFALSLSNYQVNESSPSGTEIGTIAVKDYDLNRTYSFEILSDNAFSINGSKLFVGDPGADCFKRGGYFCNLDFESRTQHTIIIRVKDNGVPSLSEIFTVTVEVTDINDAPRAILIDVDKVLETTLVNSLVAHIEAVDDDVNQTLAYNLTPNPYFEMKGQDVILKQDLDFETAKELSIEVNVVDNGSPPLTSSVTFTMKVIDANEAPVSIVVSSTADSLSAFQTDKPSLPENLPAMTFIGQTVVVDRDGNDSIRIESVSVDVVIKRIVCISVSLGTRCTADLRSAGEFDYESEPFVNMTLIATDSGGLQILKNISLSIEDRNDPPTEIYLNGSNSGVINVTENSRGILLAKLSAKDTEPNQNYMFTILGENPNLFVIGSNLMITSAASFDYETMPMIIFSLRVTDDGTPPMQFKKDITLLVTDVNEAPSDLILPSSSVAESAQPGDVVGRLTAVDPDNVIQSNRQTFTFSVKTDGDAFRIENDQLVVASAYLDYERKNKYQVVVTVTDNGIPALSSTFTRTIEISDINEPPTSLKLSVSSVEENAKLGTIVGTFSASDPDLGQTFVFSISGNAVLTLNNNTVVLNGPLNYESGPLLKFNATVKDSGMPPLSIERNFTLAINDINEPPKTMILLDDRDMTISESARVDDQVAVVQVFDEDFTERLILEILEGKVYLGLKTNYMVCSVITTSQRNGTLCNASMTLAQILDYETEPGQIDVTLQVKDKGGLTLQKTFTFTKANANEPPLDIVLDTGVTVVPENEPNFVIGTLITTDDDTADNHSYIVVSPWETFAVVGDKLVAKLALDFERKSVYNVSVRSRDDGIPPQSITKVFIINVGDMNEAPSNISLVPSEIDRKALLGQVVSEVHIIDPDNVGKSVFEMQNHSCSVIPDNFVEMDSTKKRLKIKASPPAEANNIKVTITCSDSGTPSLSMSKDFTLTLVDAVDAPKEIQLLSLTGVEDINVAENTVNVVIGKLSVINSLTKAPINGGFRFATPDVRFNITGDQIRLTQSLDYESDVLHRVVLSVIATGTAAAGNNVSISRNFTIKVEDINEAPTGIGISDLRTVKENSEQGTSIGELYTLDSENYQNYIYTLQGVNYGLTASSSNIKMLNAFNINGRVLRVGKDANFINFETNDTFALLINTRDSGEPPYNYTGLVILKVQDMNDPPTDITLSNNLIAENSLQNTVVGYLTVVDEDLNQDQMCEIVNLLDHPFKIIENLSLVVAREILDYEKQMTYSVEVTCGDTIEDGTRLRYTKNFIVNVTNINEPPVDITLTANSFEENNVVGQIIAEIRATDLDSKEVQLAVIDSGDETMFKIKGNGTLVATKIFDFEKGNSYEVVIKAEDDQGESIQETFKLEVIDVNEEPSEIQLDNTVISERAEPGFTVGRFSTLDPDRNQQFHYSITGGVDALDSFVVKENLLMVGTNGLDYEKSSSVKLTVVSQDNGSPAKSVEQDFIVEIQDANEPLKAIVIGSLKPIAENTKVNAILASFTLDDSDINQHHSCHTDNNIISVSSKATGDFDLILTGEVNYETNKTLDVSLVCTDGEFEVSKNLTVDVLDVNERPSALRLNGTKTILANATEGTVIGYLFVEDEDIGQSHTFTITGPNSDIFEITEERGLVLKGSVPDRAVNNIDHTIQFTVTVVDNGTPMLSLNKTFILPVTDIPITADTLPKMSLTDVFIYSKMKRGSVIGRLTAESSSLPSTIIFTLVLNPGEYFAIENNTFLILSKEIDSDNITALQIKIQVENTATGMKDNRAVTVIVQDEKLCSWLENVCGANETCIAKNETFHVCECQKDFKFGKDEVCERIDDCKLEESETACLNGGTCVDDVESYTCQCAVGFSGSNCEIKDSVTSPCAENLCMNSAVCIPSDDSTTYQCLCQPGWKGDMCNISVDDCIEAVCYNNGTCVDQHLTYNCVCNVSWQGKRCEYSAFICTEKYCNDTHVCVGLMFKTDTLCISEDIYVVKLNFAKPNDTDIGTFQDQLIDFIIKYGRLTRLFQSGMNRRKRELNTEDPQIFVVSAEETGDKFVFDMVVMDDEETPKMKEEVLRALSITCQEINSRDQNEVKFCPSLLEAAQVKQMNAPEKKSRAGVVAGVIVTVLLVILGSVVIVILIRHEKRYGVKPEEEATAHTAGNSYASMPTDSAMVHAEQTDRTIYLEPSDIESSQRIAIASDADLKDPGSLIETEQQEDNDYPPRIIRVIEPEQHEDSGYPPEVIRVIEPEQQEDDSYPPRVIQVLSAEESHDFTGESNA